MIRHSVCVVGLLAVLLGLACGSSEEQEGADTVSISPTTRAIESRSATMVPTELAATTTSTTPTGGDTAVATPSGTPSQGPVILRRAQSSAGPTGESVVVKFVDGMTVRLTEAGLVSLGPQDVEAVRAVFARHPILEVAPVFTQPVAELEEERHRLEEATGKSLPDLTLFFRLTLGADADAALFVADLAGLNVIETAYVVPPPEPPPAP